MGGRCHKCKITEPYHYWTRLPETEHKFLEIMPTNFKTELKVSQKFIDCFKGEISTWVTLKGPSKNTSTWKVKISRERRGILFSEGWSKFVRDHEVEESDILVFHYRGNSAFHVSVFEKTGCEREAAHFAINGNNNPICTSSLHCNENPNNNNSRRSCHSDSDTRIVIVLDDEDEEHSINFSPLRKTGEKANHKENSESDDEEEESEEEEEEEEDADFLKEGSSAARKIKRVRVYKSNRKEPTSEEKKEALRMAWECMCRSMREGVPNFLLTLKATHVYWAKYAAIPKEFHSQHMLGYDHEVVLKLGDKSWKVGCHWMESHGCYSCTLKSNWANFVEDNNLEQDDVCLFELIQAGDKHGRVPIFRVHIFRVVAKIEPLTKEWRITGS